MTSYRLKITVLSPLHIGTGDPALRQGIDFIACERTLYVFDTTRVLAYLLGDGDDSTWIEQLSRTQNLADLVCEQDFHQHPHLARYRLNALPGVNDIQPQLKDIYERPYLPGSSLKGAIRTLLLDAELLARGTPVDMNRLPIRERYAAQELEREIAGRGGKPGQAASYDLFRALHISDSTPIPPDRLSLKAVTRWPSSERIMPCAVETIAVGNTFSTTLKINDYLFGAAATRLDLASRRTILDNLAATCRSQIAAQIANEHAFFARHNAQPICDFYTGLAAHLADSGPHSFFLHMGWGAGWNSKTIARALHQNNVIKSIARRYCLDRGKPRSDFPCTRHLVIEQGHPLTPLGWVRVDMDEAGS